MQMRIMASKKAVLAAKAELGRLTKENSQLDEARGVAVGRRDAIIQKVHPFIILFCFNQAGPCCIEFCVLHLIGVVDGCSAA